MEYIKKHIGGLIAGIILTIVAFLGYFFYQGIKTSMSDHATIKQMADYINQQIRANQVAAPVIKQK